MRGFPWAPMATCTSLTPCRTTAARTTAATLLSPDYAPSSRRSPWLSQSGAVGLQNTKNMARRDAVTPCLLLNQQLILHEIEGRTAWLFLKKILWMYLHRFLCIPAGLSHHVQVLCSSAVRLDWATFFDCHMMCILSSVWLQYES